MPWWGLHPHHHCPIAVRSVASTASCIKHGAQVGLWSRTCAYVHVGPFPQVPPWDEKKKDTYSPAEFRVRTILLQINNQAKCWYRSRIPKKICLNFKQWTKVPKKGEYLTFLRDLPDFIGDPDWHILIFICKNFTFRLSSSSKFAISSINSFFHFFFPSYKLIV